MSFGRSAIFLTPSRLCKQEESGYSIAMATPTTPEEWFARAAEVRAIAASLHDPGAIRTMLNIASGYERMARHTASGAEQNATQHNGPDRD